MDRFIDAISNRGRNSFVGAHDVLAQKGQRDSCYISVEQ